MTLFLPVGPAGGCPPRGSLTYRGVWRPSFRRSCPRAVPGGGVPRCHGGRWQTTSGKNSEKTTYRKKGRRARLRQRWAGGAGYVTWSGWSGAPRYAGWGHPGRRVGPPGPSGTTGGGRAATTKYEKKVQNAHLLCMARSRFLFFPIQNNLSENIYAGGRPLPRVSDPNGVAGYMRMQRHVAQRGCPSTPRLLWGAG